MQFVKMIRFHQNGFICGSPARHKENNPVFINRVVHNLFLTSQTIYTTEIIFPNEEDRDWDGCFCYLEENTMQTSGTRTIGFLPRESTIWVRNISHVGDGIPYYNRSLHPLVEDESGDGENMITDTWVQMSVEDALERTRLWKEKSVDLPGWVTECYLTELQVKRLIYPSSNEKVMEFWLSKN
ncbi:hypothetical protein N5C46_09125 [Rossellomorea vietnamensis]|uniref:Uncharacterized protein n=1 Tax=Rossellomorea vietnamensis TaxID=218284 RepID=A0ACD4CCR5_9BACI|nr:hypothetical protein [Rossellomorea vietnamensis]UXH46186.1 hypothetical protein N5C46_09125 [Rossellomorea vietnamensis]